MTVIRIADRLARLERGSTRSLKDVTEARRRFVEQLLGVIRVLESGDPPSNAIGHALVEFDFDVNAAVMALYERKQRGEPLVRP